MSICPLCYHWKSTGNRSTFVGLMSERRLSVSTMYTDNLNFFCKGVFFSACGIGMAFAFSNASGTVLQVNATDAMSPYTSCILWSVGESHLTLKIDMSHLNFLGGTPLVLSIRRLCQSVCLCFYMFFLRLSVGTLSNVRLSFTHLPSISLPLRCMQIIYWLAIGVR